MTIDFDNQNGNSCPGYTTRSWFNKFVETYSAFVSYVVKFNCGAIKPKNRRTANKTEASKEFRNITTITK